MKPLKTKHRQTRSVVWSISHGSQMEAERNYNFSTSDIFVLLKAVSYYTNNILATIFFIHSRIICTLRIMIRYLLFFLNMICTSCAQVLFSFV